MNQSSSQTSLPQSSVKVTPVGTNYQYVPSPGARVSPIPARVEGQMPFINIQGPVRRG